MADATATPVDSGQTTDRTYTGPVGGSGAYGIYKATAQQAFDSAQQQLGAQRTAFLHSQGMVGQYDPTTHAFTGKFSMNGLDPTGAYQQLLGGNAGQGAADESAIAGSGLGGGLAQQMHEHSQQGLSANAADWATKNQAQLDQFSNDAVTNENNLTSGLFTNLQGDIETAIAQGTYNPADYTGISIDGQGFTAPKGPDLGGTGSGTTGGGGYGTGGSTGSGGLNGHPQATAQHPYYRNYIQNGGKLSLRQWRSAGKPRH